MEMYLDIEAFSDKKYLREKGYSYHCIPFMFSYKFRDRSQAEECIQTKYFVKKLSDFDTIYDEFKTSLLKIITENKVKSVICFGSMEKIMLREFGSQINIIDLEENNQSLKNFENDYYQDNYVKLKMKKMAFVLKRMFDQNHSFGKKLLRDYISYNQGDIYLLQVAEKQLMSAKIES